MLPAPYAVAVMCAALLLAALLCYLQAQRLGRPNLRKLSLHPDSTLTMTKVSDGTILGAKPEFLAVLRLDTVSNDGLGWTAAFYGTPSITDSRIHVPVSDEVAAALHPGEEYAAMFARWDAFEVSE